MNKLAAILLLALGIFSIIRARAFYSQDHRRSVRQKFIYELKVFFSFGFYKESTPEESITENFLDVFIPMNLFKTYGGGLLLIAVAGVVYADLW